MPASSTGVQWILGDTEVASAYLIETSLLEAIAALSLLLALLLLLSSAPRFSAQPVAQSKRFFHAIVAICCILNVVKSVDNEQVFNRFHSNAYIVIFITNNITPLLMMGGAVLIWNTIDVQHRINKSHTPTWLLWGLALLSIANFVVINTLTALAVSRLQQLYYMYLLYYMLASFGVLLLMADVSVWNVRQLVVKYHVTTSTAVRSKAIAAERSLYPLYAFVVFLNLLLFLVIAALAYQANLIATTGKSDDPPDRADPTQWKIDVFAWVHVVTIIVYIWWSWVPLHVLRLAARKLCYSAGGDESGVMAVAHDSGQTGEAGGHAVRTHAVGARGSILVTGTASPSLQQGAISGQVHVAARTQSALDSTTGQGSINHKPISARGSGSHGRLFQQALSTRDAQTSSRPLQNGRVSPAPHSLGVDHSPLVHAASVSLAASSPSNGLLLQTGDSVDPAVATTTVHHGRFSSRQVDDVEERSVSREAAGVPEHLVATEREIIASSSHPSQVRLLQRESGSTANSTPSLRPTSYVTGSPAHAAFGSSSNGYGARTPGSSGGVATSPIASSIDNPTLLAPRRR